MISTSLLVNLTYFRGRVALYAILKALDIGVGDEIATQAFTCVAVPEAIMATGARPTYIDLEPTSFNMDASDLQNKITSRTRAIVVQHTFGIPAEMDQIREVAAKAGLPIIEDCCHTLVSQYRGKLVGTFGVASFYSYEWGKPIVVGIGGSALINDADLHEKVQHQYTDYRLPASANQFRLQLQYLAHHILYRPSLYWPVRSLYHTLGSFGAAESNYNPIQPNGMAQDFSLRMSNALRKRLVDKLQKLDAQAVHSRSVATEYKSRIDSLAVAHPILPINSQSIFARYPLLARDKQKLLTQARNANVELANWYSTPIHPISSQESHLVHYEAGSCPNAEIRCKQVVTLPTHGRVKKRDIDRTVQFLNEVTE